jgi:hypothetical protein
MSSAVPRHHWVVPHWPLFQPDLLLRCGHGQNRVALLCWVLQKKLCSNISLEVFFDDSSYILKNLKLSLKKIQNMLTLRWLMKSCVSEYPQEKHDNVTKAITYSS